MPPMTATVTQIPAEDHDDDGRHRDQRDRAQQHRDRHEGVLGALAQLEQRGSEDRGDQTRDEPDERVTQRDHEIAHDELAVRRRGGDREEVVPDVDRTLGDQRRDLEDPEHTHPDGQGGDESQDEGQQAPAEGAQDVPGRRAADIATEVCGRRCGGLKLGGGGQGGHHFPFDQGAIARATSPSSMKPSSATAPLARARAQTSGALEFCWARIIAMPTPDSIFPKNSPSTAPRNAAGHRDLQRAQDGRKRGDQAHLDELGEPAAAVDGDEVEARLVGGLEPEQGADDGREEDRQRGQQHGRAARLTRGGRLDQDDREDADRDDRDAVGDDRELGDDALEPGDHEDEPREDQRDAVAPHVADARLGQRHREVAPVVLPAAVDVAHDDFERRRDGVRTGRCRRTASRPSTTG